MENITRPENSPMPGSSPIPVSQEPPKMEQPSHKWEADKWYRVRNRTDQDIKSKRGVTIINANKVRSISGKEILQKFDSKQIEELEGSEQIFIRELDCNPARKYRINNLTSKRITINHYNLVERNFFVPGFGSRDLSGTALIELDYPGWENQGLIQVIDITDEIQKPEIQNTAVESLMGLTFILLALFLLVGIPYAIRQAQPWVWAVIGVVTLAALVVVARLFSYIRKNNKEFLQSENLNNWLKLLPGITLILVTGVGLPALIIYVYGEGLQFFSSQFGGSLGRFLQTGFIAIASMLPAFLFYLFGRQQVAKQRENFYREAMLLDPNVWSENEAKNKYGPLLDTVFDTGNSPFSIILLVTSTALIVTGWITVLAPIGPLPAEVTDLVSFFRPDLSPFSLGFLGAYFFTINLVYRRYVRADLTPKTYAYITMRLITTYVLVWALGTLPQFGGANFLNTGLSAVAFIIGIFPESALTLIQDYANKVTASRRGQDPNKYSLTKLEGMNLYDQARLMEEGIENIENLAHHNLMELIVRTRIPTARLVDMFDQAILYLHLGEEVEDAGSGGSNGLETKAGAEDLRKFLKNFGIRTATDLLGCMTLPEFRDDERNADVVKRLKIIITSLEDDEWLNYIQSWRAISSTMNEEPIGDPYKFYFRVTEVSQGRSSAPFPQSVILVEKIETPPPPGVPNSPSDILPVTPVNPN